MRKIALVAFDVDGVLVTNESCWEYLHKAFGTYDSSRKYFEMYANKKISYYDWMFLDTYEWIARFNGRLPRDVILKELDKISINSEFEPVISYLREKGIKIALISGGIDLLVRRIADAFKADYWFSNILLFDENDTLIPGGIPIVPADKKGELLRALRNELGLEKENVAYVGDSEWDKSAFLESGLSIVFGNKRIEWGCINVKTPWEIIEAIKKYEDDVLLCSDTK